MLDIFKKGASEEFDNPTLLPNSGKFVSGTRYTLEIMEQSPSIIFIYNPFGKSPTAKLTLLMQCIIKL
ncbi:MAG: hypothetical protein RSD22_10775 [Romboutsia sp.]